MICDPMWKASFEAGQVIEEANFMGHRMVFISLSVPTGVFHYPYRMFFFPENADTPSLVLSLEIGTLFHTCCLGGHTSTMHENYGSADPNMSREDFRSWALTKAEKSFN